LDARHAVERRGYGVADPVVSVTHPPPPPLAEEAVQGLCREGNAGCVAAVALAGPLHPVTEPGPAVSAAVALRVRERRDAWHPEAQAQDVAEPFVLHVGVWARAGVRLGTRAPRPQAQVSRYLGTKGCISFCKVEIKRRSGRRSGLY
jgi:hypothetical protein